MKGFRWDLRKLALAGAILLAVTVSAVAQEQPQPPAQGGKLQDGEQIRQRIEQTGPTTYKIGDVQVDAASRQLVFSGEVNMATGLAEVVVCTLWGKLHESVIRTSAQPMDIHIGLLLLGLKDGGNPGWYVPPPLSTEKPREPVPAGDKVNVFVRWQDSGQWQECRAEHLVLNLQSGESLPDTPWVFIGSYLDTEGGYVADYVGSILTNYHDRSSVLDCPLEQGQVDDYMYVNSSLVPPVGTPVEIRIAVAQSDPGFLQMK